MKTYDKKLISLKKLCYIVAGRSKIGEHDFILTASIDEKTGYYKITQSYIGINRDESTLFETYEDAVIKLAEFLDYVLR